MQQPLHALRVEGTQQTHDALLRLEALPDEPIAALHVESSDLIRARAETGGEHRRTLKRAQDGLGEGDRKGRLEHALVGHGAQLVRRERIMELGVAGGDPQDGGRGDVGAITSELEGCGAVSGGPRRVRTGAQAVEEHARVAVVAGIQQQAHALGVDDGQVDAVGGQQKLERLLASLPIRQQDGRDALLVREVRVGVAVEEGLEHKFGRWPTDVGGPPHRAAPVLVHVVGVGLAFE